MNRNSARASKTDGAGSSNASEKDTGSLQRGVAGILRDNARGFLAHPVRQLTVAFLTQISDRVHFVHDRIFVDHCRPQEGCRI